MVQAVKRYLPYNDEDFLSVQALKVMARTGVSALFVSHKKWKGKLPVCDQNDNKDLKHFEQKRIIEAMSWKAFSNLNGYNSLFASTLF